MFCDHRYCEHLRLRGPAFTCAPGVFSHTRASYFHTLVSLRLLSVHARPALLKKAFLIPEAQNRAPNSFLRLHKLCCPCPGAELVRSAAEDTEGRGRERRVSGLQSASACSQPRARTGRHGARGPARPRREGRPPRNAETCSLRFNCLSSERPVVQTNQCVCPVPGRAAGSPRLCRAPGR